MRKGALIWTAALVGLALAGCSSSSSSYNREVAAQVQTSSGAGMPDLDVTVWIVDVDLPGDVRQPMELEPQTTDATGRVSWQVEAEGQPYVCGFRVETSLGTVMGYSAPDLNQRLSTPDGLTVITL